MSEPGRHEESSPKNRLRVRYKPISKIRSVSADLNNTKVELAKAREDSLTDDLTGLLTKKAFYTEAATYIAGAERRDESFALVMMDINDFKEVNDEKGHLVGDEVIRETGQAFAETLRKGDIVARFGGDEFIALLTGHDERPWKAVTAFTVQDRVEELIKLRLINSDVSSIKVSIGVDFSSKFERHDLLDMIRNADAMMYKEKARRKKYV